MKSPLYHRIINLSRPICDKQCLDEAWKEIFISLYCQRVYTMRQFYKPFGQRGNNGII